MYRDYHIFAVFSGLAKRVRARLLMASTSEVYGGMWAFIYNGSRSGGGWGSCGLKQIVRFHKHFKDLQNLLSYWHRSYIIYYGN